MLTISGKPINAWLRQQNVSNTPYMNQMLTIPTTSIKQYKKNPRIIDPLASTPSQSPTGAVVFFSALGFFLAFLSCRRYLLNIDKAC